MVDMIIQCEGKYPTVQLKTLPGQGWEEKYFFYEENIFLQNEVFLYSSHSLLCSFLAISSLANTILEHT